MNFLEGVIRLFEETAALPVGRACQVNVGGTWRTVPLEWNGTLRLADILGTEARMVAADGTPFRAYPEVKEHA